MAWNFDGGDAAWLENVGAVTLPDGDWAMGGLIKFSTRVGTLRRYIIKGGSGYTSSFFVRIGDDGGPDADDVNIAFLDDDGTVINASSTGNPFASNTSWTHLLLQRSGTTITVYVNGSSVASVSNASFDALAPNDWIQFGNEQYFSNGFRGDLAEWAKWDRTLSSAEIAGLVQGYAPSCYPNSLMWYVPMIRDYNEIRNGIEVDNDGSTVTEHPRMIYCGD